MARNSNVKLAIVSTYDDKGSKKAYSAMSSFEKRVNTAGSAAASTMAQASIDAQMSAENIAQKWEAAGTRMQSVGKGLTTAVTLPIAAIGGASIAASIEVESSFANVRKTVDATEEEYDSLLTAARDLATQSPVDVNTINDIMALGGQLGIAKDNLVDFAQIVSGLDIATNMDSETAATELAQFANITNMAESDMSRYASTLVALGNNSATTESNISAMAMRIGAASSQLKMSQSDTLALAATMASLGIEAEAGGTAISTIMATVDKEVATNGKTLETWAATAGMSAADFKAAWEGDVTGALVALISGMGKAVDEGGNMSLMLSDLGIDSIRQTDVLKRMANSSDLLTDSLGLANAAWADNSALQNEVDAKNDTTAAKLETLKNRVYDVGIELGDALVPAFTDLLDAATPIIDVVKEGAEAFSAMDKESQQAAITTLAVAAAAGPLLTVGGKLSTQIGGLVRSYGEFKAASLAKKAALLAEQEAALAASVANTKMTATNTILGTSMVTTSNKTKLLTNWQKQGAVWTTQAASANSTYAATATKASGATSKLATGLKGLKTAAVSLAVISTVVSVISHFSSEMDKAKERSSRLKSATTDLENSMGAMGDAYLAASSGAADASASVDDLAAASTNALDSQIELAQKLTESWSTVGTNSALIEGYAQTISNLADKSNLTAEEQAQLATAVSGFNELTGISVSIIDPLNGKLSEQKDAILAVAEAYKEQARVQAAQEAIVELEKQRIMNATELEAAVESLSTMEEGLLVKFGDVELASDEAGRAYEEQKQKVEDLTAAKESLDNQIDATNQILTESVDAVNQSADAITALISSNTNITTAFEESGQSIESFAGGLSDLGVSTTTLATLSDEQLAIMASSYDGTLGSILAKCDEFGITLPADLASNLSAGQPDVSAASDTLAAASIDPISGLPMRYQSEASLAVQQFSTGLASGITPTGNKADQLAGAAGRMKNVGDTYSWGAESGNNYASGLSSTWQAIANAADYVMAAAADRMKHSKPKEGPLSEGEEIWGVHAGENFGDGLFKSADYVGRGATFATLAAREAFEQPFDSAWGYNATPFYDSTYSAHGSAGQTTNIYNFYIDGIETTKEELIRQIANDEFDQWDRYARS